MRNSNLFKNKFGDGLVGKKMLRLAPYSLTKKLTSFDGV